MTARHPNGFRFSEAFIRRWTIILTVAMFAIAAVGIGLGVASDADGAPTWLGELATAVLVTAIVGPLLAAAVLGGESIRRGGGLIGVLVTAGLLAGATGEVMEIRWLMWSGGVVLALGIAGFWIIGWIAKVPMYVGLPWAHGKVVQRDDSRPKDRIASDDPRLRPKRQPDGSASSGPRR